jgi:hypothetical protein
MWNKIWFSNIVNLKIFRSLWIIEWSYSGSHLDHH